MRLARMGAFHQTRLSFMRTLLRRLKQQCWTFDVPLFDIDEKGVGRAVYRANGPERSYSLVCFGHDLPDEERSDRVIAHAWDCTFALFDGTPTDADIERLSQNVPKQEAGRISRTEITLSRANRSARLFNYVVDCLSEGKQPEAEKIDEVGYLMRTTAVYGSGKFGAVDRDAISDRVEFAGAFQAEMLTVYLIRTFVLDLVEHLASLRAPKKATKLEAPLRRKFGIGNSTGLGMAPFLINHPVLLNNWMVARETALARVIAIEFATADSVSQFRGQLLKATNSVGKWRSSHVEQQRKIETLLLDIDRLTAHVAQFDFSLPRPWARLVEWTQEHCSFEAQELLNALVMEPHPELVDDLAETMSADENHSFAIDGSMPIADLVGAIEEIYGWAIETDWTDHESIARVWYVSQEKLEPRLGERFEEPIEPYEQPLAPGRDVALLHAALLAWYGSSGLAEFLMKHPEHRHSVRRVQIAKRFHYAEIRDNTIASHMLPIDLLRCKLSFFGATNFDPRSDRWVRINMFKNAPFPLELQQHDEDNWPYAEPTIV